MARELPTSGDAAVTIQTARPPLTPHQRRARYEASADLFLTTVAFVGEHGGVSDARDVGNGILERKLALTVRRGRDSIVFEGEYVEGRDGEPWGYVISTINGRTVVTTKFHGHNSMSELAKRRDLVTGRNRLRRAQQAMAAAEAA